MVFSDPRSLLPDRKIPLSLIWFLVLVADEGKELLLCLFGLVFLHNVFLQDHRQFKQRYYEFRDHFRVPDGPIFLKICGESACPGISNDYVGVSSKFVADLRSSSLSRDLRDGFEFLLPLIRVWIGFVHLFSDNF